MSSFADDLDGAFRNLSLALSLCRSAQGFLTSGQDQTLELVVLVGQSGEGDTRELVQAAQLVSEAKVYAEKAVEFILEAMAAIQAYKDQLNLS